MISLITIIGNEIQKTVEIQNQKKERLMQECINDGKKEYECQSLLEDI